MSGPTTPLRSPPPTNVTPTDKNGVREKYHSPFKSNKRNQKASPSELADSLSAIRLSDDDYSGKDKEKGEEAVVSDTRSRVTSTLSSSTTSSSLSLSPSSSSSSSSSASSSTQGATEVFSLANETSQSIAQGIDNLRRQIFEMQEQRHVGGPLDLKLADRASNMPGGGEAAQDYVSNEDEEEKRIREQQEKTKALDLAMIKLNEVLVHVSEKIGVMDKQLGILEEKEEEKEAEVDEFGVKKKDKANRPTLGHRGSMSSISSFSSFDQAFFSPPEGTSGLRKRYHEMLNDWDKVQAEVKAVEEELSADKYMVVFSSISGQAQDIMDSLDKALAQCHDFVFAYNRDRASAAMGGLSEDEENGWNPAARLEELKHIKHSFDVKKRSYGPACEQMFSSMERGVNQRSVKNGSILRRFSELKTRWHSLRDRVTRMDKELKRMEVALCQTVSGSQGEAGISSESPASSLASIPNHQPSALGYGSTPRGTVQPRDSTRNLSSTSTIRDIGMRSSSLSSSASPLPHRSPSAGNLMALLSSTPPSSPPVKPPKSIHRLSVYDGRSPTGATAAGRANVTGQASLTHNRSMSSTAATPPRAVAGAVRIPGSAPRLPSSARSSMIVGSLPAEPQPVRLSPSRQFQGLSPQPPSSWRQSARGLERSSARAGSEPPDASLASDSPSSRFANARERSRSSLSVDDEDEERLADMSTESIGAEEARRPPRPASVAGMFYRPPSAIGYVREGEEMSTSAGGLKSRIPRLAVASSSAASDRSGGGTDTRPGSAMSFASSTNTATRAGATPRFGARPPNSYNMIRGASRSSMMTPEPTITARAQRFGLFAPRESVRMSSGSTEASSATGTPAKRSSRPPPVKYNVTSVYAQNRGSENSGSSTRPLSINKRNSSLLSSGPGSSSGRATPLSAAALATLPNDQPRSGHLGTSSPMSQSGSATETFQSGTPSRTPNASSLNSSVANFRASRAAAVGDSSLLSSFQSSGNATGYQFPRTTSSYTGSVASGRETPSFSDGGRSIWRGNGGGGAMFRPYRPNRNDALDVEVGTIVNYLGVPVERVDPPLGRGQKSEPNKSVRYDVAGKVVVCKLLELHRPTVSASVSGGQEKARKVLTRVGGGWIDLEQHILSRMGSM